MKTKLCPKCGEPLEDVKVFSLDNMPWIEYYHVPDIIIGKNSALASPPCFKFAPTKEEVQEAKNWNTPTLDPPVYCACGNECENPNSDPDPVCKDCR